MTLQEKEDCSLQHMQVRTTVIRMSKMRLKSSMYRESTMDVQLLKIRN